MIFDLDNWQEIAAAMRKNKLRTALTAFGVFWGIFMLVLMLGSGNGLRNGVLAEFSGTATNSFFMWTQSTSKPYKGLQPNRSYNFTIEDAAALRQNLSELKIIAPMNQLGGYRGENNVIRGLKTAAFSVYGVHPEIKEIQQFNLTEGRFINVLDIRDRRKIAVVGEQVIEKLFLPGENPIGQYVKVNGVNFMVAGTLKGAGKGNEAREQAGSIYIPFSAFAQAFNMGNKVGWFSIKSADNVSASLAEQKAMELLKERHNIAPDDARAIGHWNMEVEFNKLSGLFMGIEMLVWFVGIGTLMAGVIGVSNIMLIVVKERTREIGVRRAIGATPLAIVSQLIIESVTLTAVAGYAGLVAGIGLLELVNKTMPPGGVNMFVNPGVDLYVALKALGILIFSGALAGFIPAQRALEISPVEALRTE
jgi:putative ABC transport system permease protein